MVIQHSASEAIPAENTQTVSERLTQPFSDNILPPQNSGESEADRPEIEPVHAATALQGNDKQEAHSEMVDDKVSEGVQGHTEEVPDETGVLQTEASVTVQPEDMDKTSPVVSDNLSPDTALSALRPGKYLREWRIKHPLPPEKCRRCLSCCQMHGQVNPTMFDWK